MLRSFSIISAALLIATPAFAQDAPEPLAVPSDRAVAATGETGEPSTPGVAEETPAVSHPAVRKVTARPKPAARRIISAAQAADETTDAGSAAVSEPASGVAVTDHSAAAAGDPNQTQEPLALPGIEKSPGTQGSALASVGTGLDIILRFAFVLALAYLSVVGLKMYAARSGKPFKFGNRALVVEESTPLASGVYIHLVRLGERRWLVGSSQSQISILSNLDGEDSLEAGSQPSGIASVQITRKASDSPVGPGASMFSALENLLRPSGREAAAIASQPIHKPARPEPPAAQVAGELRKSAEFISEMRARLQDKA